VLTKPLRANQQDGFVSEAYAEASSKVENLKRLKKELKEDPERWFRLSDLHRKATNYREQARTRKIRFEEIEDDLCVPELLEKDRLNELVAERAQLVGEIFIRLFQIDLVSKAARRAIGA
jgi:16S rRNA C967 or C1407 C5-methylase (RsmB/RsmF family)